MNGENELYGNLPSLFPACIRLQILHSTVCDIFFIHPTVRKIQLFNLYAKLQYTDQFVGVGIEQLIAMEECNQFDLLCSDFWMCLVVLCSLLIVCQSSVKKMNPTVGKSCHHPNSVTVYSAQSHCCSLINVKSDRIVLPPI